MLRAAGPAGEIDEQVPRDANFGDCDGLLKGIAGISAWVLAANEVEIFQHLVRPGDRRGVDAALARDFLERELAAPVATAHALLPVQPKHPLGRLRQSLLPEPALERF